MHGLLQRMDSAARNLFPLGLAVVAVLLGTTPLYLPSYGQVAPDLALMVVFYWAIYRPDLFPALAAFAVGLVQDALMGTPLGLNALVLLAVHAVVVSQRRFFQGKSFQVVWWAFSLVAFGAGILSWLIVAAVNARLIDPAPGLFATLTTVALYPLATWAIARIHHAILTARLHVPR